MSVRLWDGKRHALGRDTKSPLEIHIHDPGVIASLLRWPALDTLLRHYIDGRIDIGGGTLYDFGLALQKRGSRGRLTASDTLRMAARLWPFVLAPGSRPIEKGTFSGDYVGHHRTRRDNKDYVQFHYDLSNDFYALFLDPEMVYSCAYYTDWTNDLATAQHDKLEMICRKLRLKPGERLLDIGCGWGGLICHAARHHGVTAHGITLSKAQIDFARDKVRRLGLENRITVALADYTEVEGTYEKIASIGMYEHIGLENIPTYMSKVRRLLSEDGLFLNHAISGRAEKPRLIRRRMRPERKAIAKYIFPGGELDDIGHTLAAMELAGFEVQDVEGWRMHYARTCRLWCERLTAEREKAIEAVGEEKYRIWVAYLAGVALAFNRGTLRLYQTLVSRSAKRPPPLPPTRADLYR